MTADDTPSMRVVDKVATRTGVDPEELPPLYDAINPDVIETVLQTDSARVVFEYAGHTIIITEESQIRVESSEKSTD
ncbi:HalOD1 output domain-containing protein [Halopiger aswanensis]